MKRRAARLPSVNDSKLAVGKLINVFWGAPYNQWYTGSITQISKRGTKIAYNDGETHIHANIEFMRYEIFDDLNEEVTMSPRKEKRLFDVAMEELKCGICLNIFTNPYTPKGCAHAFCYGCISRWIQEPQRNTCPMCTTKIVSMRDCYAHPGLEKLASALRDETNEEQDAGAAANELIALSSGNNGSVPLSLARCGGDGSCSTHTSPLRTKKESYLCHTCGGFKKHRNMSCNPNTCEKA